MFGHAQWSEIEGEIDVRDAGIDRPLIRIRFGETCVVWLRPGEAEILRRSLDAYLEGDLSV